MTFEDYLLQEAHLEDTADDIVKIAAELDTMTDEELCNLESIIDEGEKEKLAEATLLADMASDAIRDRTDSPPGGPPQPSPEQVAAQQADQAQQGPPQAAGPPQQMAGPPPQQGPPPMAGAQPGLPPQGMPPQGQPPQGMPPEVMAAVTQMAAQRGIPPQQAQAMVAQRMAAQQQAPPQGGPPQGMPPQMAQASAQQVGPPGAGQGMPPQMMQSLMQAVAQQRQQQVGQGQPPQGMPMKTASMDTVDGWAREMAQHELRKKASSEGMPVSQAIMAEAVQHLVAGNIRSFEDVSWGMNKIAALEKEAINWTMIKALLKAFGKSWKKGALGPRGSLTSLKGLKGTKKIFRAGPYKGIQKAYAKGKAGYGQQNLMAYRQLAKQLGHLTGRGAPVLAGGAGLYAAS
jgi:hypothetical protein